MISDPPDLATFGLPLILQLGSPIELRFRRREFVALKFFEQGVKLVFIPELGEVEFERRKHRRVPFEVDFVHTIVGNRKLARLLVSLEV